MKADILLFTFSFPYGSSEQFLETEIPYLCNNFNVYIQPLTGDLEKTRSVPAGTIVCSPLLNFSHKNKVKLIFNGIFNTAPIFFIFSELFKMRVFKSFKRFSAFVSYSLITRIAYNKISRLIKENSSLNAFYFYWGDIQTGVLLFDKWKTRSVVRFHNSDLYEYLHDDYIPFRSKVLQKIDLIACISNDGLNYLNGKYNVINKANVFRLGVKDHYITNQNPDKQNKFVIVSCSFIRPIKRVDLIAHAILMSELEITWHHFGNGEQMEEIKTIIYNAGNNKNIILHGQQSNENVLRFYKENYIHLFVNASISEGVPVSIMEALSFGIPVLATNVGGTGEIVNDRNGLLVPVNISAYDFSQTINKLLLSKNYNLLRDEARNTFLEKCDAKTNYPFFTNEISKLLS